MDAPATQGRATPGQSGRRSPVPGRANATARPTSDNCRLLEAKLRRLEEQLQIQSRQFSDAIGKLSANNRAKSRAEQLDERFIEQCVRARTQAEIDLTEKSKLYAAHVEKIKVESQKRNNELAREINKLRQQLNEQARENQSRLAQVTQNAQHDAARYEQIITRLKTESAEKLNEAVSQVQQQYSAAADKAKHLEQQNVQLRQEFQKRISQAAGQLKQKSQAYEQAAARLKQQYRQSIAAVNNQAERKLAQKEQEIAAAKTQLDNLREQTSEMSREKARAQQLNQRLSEQCRMAKAGADVEIEMRTRQLNEDVSRVKGQAAQRLALLADENSKLKAQAEQAVAKLREHADALNRANMRIRALENVVTDLKKPLLTHPAIQNSFR
jgi:chromosome segregation ATPase